MSTYLIYLRLKDGTTRVVDSPATTREEADRDASLAYLKHFEAVNVTVRELNNMYQEES
jgi:hypothetical protein